MRTLITITASALLAGCVTDSGLALRGAAVQRAASAYDQSLSNAETWMCRGASIGSIVRAYGASDEQWAAWLRLCGYSGGDELERPEADDG